LKEGELITFISIINRNVIIDCRWLLLSKKDKSIYPFLKIYIETQAGELRNQQH